MEPQNWYQGRVRDPLISGETVTLAGQSFVVAPFNIRRTRETASARHVLRQMNAPGNAWEGPDSEPAIRAMTQIAAVALLANYPEITADMIEENLAFPELLAVLEALNKLNRGGEGNPAAPEAAGAAMSETRTGTA